MPRPLSFAPDAALEAALRLFWSRGFEGTSVQDLVEATGLSRSSLYGTFGDKQSLYLAALERYARRSGGALYADLARSSAREGITRHLRRIADAGADDPEGLREDAPGDSAMGCFVVNASAERAPHDAETHARTAASRDGMLAAFEAAVRRAQTAGEIPAERDARQLAALLTATAYGLRVLARTRPPAEVLTRAAAAAVDALG
ncbi:MAG: TetR/AcrR family transcriptional regulator [Rubricoccaceae bacterium]